MVRLDLEHDRTGVHGMSQSAELVQLLAERSSILLDFDGPICGIFANRPAPTVAESLRDVVRSAGVELAGTMQEERDPLEVLRWTATLGRPDVVRLVETKLCAEEFAASQTAEPTPHGREVIIGAFEAGKPIAVVSNNSAGAINAYVGRQRLRRYAMPIAGRAFGQPELMKPNPEPILRAVKSLSASPVDCVLIGDSLADIHGAHAAGVPVIGYANRPEKVASFVEAGAKAIVTKMAEVACVLIEMKV
jgi:HAD superfamily hydrolase (TIGR01549 family)